MTLLTSLPAAGVRHGKLKASDIPRTTPDAKYSIGAVVGRGAQGIVFLSREIATGELVAIKVCHSDRVSQTQREAEALQMLRHPSIMSIRACSVSVEKKMTFLVFELCSGGELFHKIAQAPLGYFPERACAFYFRSLIHAVAHMHRMGVAHRDIKPENLLLTASHELRISDFGLSQISVPLAASSSSDASGDKDTVTGASSSSSPSSPACGLATIGMSTAFRGSLFYMAPEVCRCVYEPTPYSTQFADIWSCGVVLFVMLTGSLPWNRATPEDANYVSLLNGEHDYPSHLSMGAIEALTACLQPDAEERMTAVELLKLPWMNTEAATSLPKEAMDALAASVSGDPNERPSKSELVRHGWLAAPLCGSGSSTAAQISDASARESPSKATSSSTSGSAAPFSTAAPSTSVFTMTASSTAGAKEDISRSRDSLTEEDGMPSAKRQRRETTASAAGGLASEVLTEPRPEMHVGRAIAALGWHAIKKKPVSIRDAVKTALETLGLRALVQHSNDNTVAEIIVLGSDSSFQSADVVREDVPMAEDQRNDLMGSGDVVCVVRVLANSDGANQIHISKPQGDMFAFHKLYKQLRSLLGDVNNGAQ